MTAPILTYMRLGWPLTGRSKEMRLIEAALSDRDCSGIVVCGAAGVGKSRIAREAMTSAASTGCEVRWVVATSSARALPLGALSSWAGPAGGDSLQLVRGVIESLTCAPNGATVVVGVDDAPLLDDLSIFVVHQIVQRGGAKVVFTVRDGEPVPAAIQEVWKEGQFDRLELQPLSRDETATLLSATLGGSLDPDAAVRLWELTRGNVLYLRNIVEQEVAEGRLVRQHGVLAVARRSGGAARLGRIDRIADRGPADLGQRRGGCAGCRRADRAGVADQDHRPGGGRGGRHAWPDHAGHRRCRGGGAGGPSALRRGAPRARGAHQAAPAAGAGCHRTRQIR